MYIQWALDEQLRVKKEIVFMRRLAVRSLRFGQGSRGCIAQGC